MGGSTRRWAVDAIEEGIATVEEDGARVVPVPAWLLPDGVRDGDVLRVERTDEDGASVVRIVRDAAATEDAFRRSREQLQRLAQRDAGGDIHL